MTQNQEHLSMFELDLYFATNASEARGVRRSEDRRIENHVAACERCSAYLAQLGALQQSAPLPPGGAPAPLRRARPHTRALSLAAALAVSAAVATLLVATPEPESPAVAVKGSPAVQLLVRRDDETLPWDGVRRLRAGDALGLRVACEGFSQVAVAATFPGAPGRWSSLSTGDCPPAGAVLPFTLVVDDEPGQERIAVVFSRAPLDDRTHADAIERRRLDAGAWVTRFELDKENAP
jgi:hypothetical protein